MSVNAQLALEAVIGANRCRSRGIGRGLSASHSGATLAGRRPYRHPAFWKSVHDACPEKPVCWSIFGKSGNPTAQSGVVHLLQLIGKMDLRIQRPAVRMA